MSDQDLYSLLGVGRGCGPAEIKSAYHKLAKQHHPDVSGGDARSAEVFKKINHAYSVLSDSTARRTYDAIHPFAGHSFAGQSSRTYKQPDGANVNSTSGFTYRHVKVDEAFDFEEWSRMQFGPTAEQKRAAAEEAVKQARATGFSSANRTNEKETYNSTGYNNAGVNWQARFAQRQQAENWESAAAAGETDRDAYRKFAQQYRKHARMPPPIMILTYVTAAAIVYTIAHAIATDNVR